MNDLRPILQTISKRYTDSFMAIHNFIVECVAFGAVNQTAKTEINIRGYMRNTRANNGFEISIRTFKETHSEFVETLLNVEDPSEDLLLQSLLGIFYEDRNRTSSSVSIVVFHNGMKYVHSIFETGVFKTLSHTKLYEVPTEEENGILFIANGSSNSEMSAIFNQYSYEINHRSYTDMLYRYFPLQSLFFLNDTYTISITSHNKDDDNNLDTIVVENNVKTVSSTKNGVTAALFTHSGNGYNSAYQLYYRHSNNVLYPVLNSTYELNVGMKNDVIGIISSSASYGETFSTMRSLNGVILSKETCSHFSENFKTLITEGNEVLKENKMAIIEKRFLNIKEAQVSDCSTNLSHNIIFQDAQGIGKFVYSNDHYSNLFVEVFPEKAVLYHEGIERLLFSKGTYNSTNVYSVSVITRLFTELANDSLQFIIRDSKNYKSRIKSIIADNPKTSYVLIDEDYLEWFKLFKKVFDDDNTLVPIYTSTIKQTSVNTDDESVSKVVICKDYNRHFEVNTSHTLKDLIGGHFDTNRPIYIYFEERDIDLNRCYHKPNPEGFTEHYIGYSYYGSSRVPTFLTFNLNDISTTINLKEQIITVKKTASRKTVDIFENAITNGMFKHLHEVLLVDRVSFFTVSPEIYTIYKILKQTDSEHSWFFSFEKKFEDNLKTILWNIRESNDFLPNTIYNTDNEDLSDKVLLKLKENFDKPSLQEFKMILRGHIYKEPSSMPNIFAMVEKLAFDGIEKEMEEIRAHFEESINRIQ